MLAAQIALTICTLGGPARAEGPNATPSALPPLPPPTTVQVIQVAQAAQAVQPVALVAPIQLRLIDDNKPEAPRPMRLELLQGGDRNLPACETPSAAMPCPVAPGRYRVTGRGMRDSEDFDVLGSGAVDVNVDRGSKAAFYTGIGVTAAGGALGLTGAFLLTAKPETSTYGTSTAGYSHRDTGDFWALYGGSLLVLGAAALVTGIVLMTKNASSRATVTAPRSAVGAAPRLAGGGV